MNIKSLWNDNNVRLQSEYKREKGQFHASSAGSCYRKQLYNYYDFPEDEVPEKLLAKFRLGTVIHEEVEKAIESSYVYEGANRLYIEQKVSIPRLNVVGTYDVGEYIVDEIEEKDKIIFNLYDIKSSAAYPWQKMFGIRKNRVPGTDKNYRLQLGTYAIAIKEYHDKSPSHYPLDVINMYLVFFKKDDSQIREVFVDNKWMSEADMYWTQLNIYLGEYERDFEDELTFGIPGVPFRGAEGNYWECNYCNYASICPSKQGR